MSAGLLISSIIINQIKSDNDNSKYNIYLIVVILVISPFIAYLFVKHSLEKSEAARYRQTEALIKAEKDFSESIFNNVPCIIILWDKDGTIKKVNYCAEEILGYSIDELIDIKWFDVYMPSYFTRKNFMILKNHDIEKVFNNMGKDKEVRIKTKNGDTVYLLFNSKIIKDKKGEVTEIISVGTDITHLRNEEKKLHNLAYCDTITDLPNRAKFERRIENIINANNQNHKFALVYADIDNFKNINDTLGHLYGDMLLKYVANLMINEVKPPDMVARLGGDEFGIIINKYNNVDNIKEYLSNISKNLNKPIVLGDHEVNITISMGIALYPDHGSDVTNLLRKADVALYNVKESGKNGCCIYSN